MRLEKGYRLWGQDIDEEHDPYEAGLGWAVRLSKDADFIGREAAAAIKERGVSRKLCCLVTDDPAVPLVGKEPLLDRGSPVGYVTSAGYGANGVNFHGGTSTQWPLMEGVDQRISVIGFVGKERTRINIFKQRLGASQVMGLPRRQHQVARISQGIDKRADFWWLIPRAICCAC